MKLSVETHIMCDRFGPEKAIELIQQAGFDCYDYSFYWMHDERNVLGDDYLEKAQKLRQLSDKLGIKCNQAHAPFEITYSDSFDCSNTAFLRIVRSMEFASVLGAKHIIVHAIKDNLPDDLDFYELNRKFYLSLEPYCQKFNICVSVENLFNWNSKALPILSNPQEHMDFVNSLNSPWFNICIDVGHSAITGYKPEEVLAALNSDILKTLHIHDNDFVVDKHLLPYADSFNWPKIMQALADIHYTGDLTFELTGFLRRLPNSLLAPGLAFAEKVGRELISNFNNN